MQTVEFVINKLVFINRMQTVEFAGEINYI